MLRIAAVGDSLSLGSRCGVVDPWPTLLSRSTLYDVRNFGAARSKAVDYGGTNEFAMLNRWNPSVVSVMLGTFDADSKWRLDNYAASLRLCRSRRYF